MLEAKVIIIGGGSSGLTAAGALKQHNIDSIIFDRDARTGDVWRKRYDRLRLHTIRGLSYLAYHKMPADYPRYVPKDNYADYLEEYAQHFALDIHHNTSVKQVSQADNQWEITLADGTVWHAQHVIIASGINQIPYLPRWDGADEYQGTFIHAVKYKTGRDFTGKRVLVIGCGNTGAELCADLIETGATHVANSIRTAPMIVPRDPLGVPIHAWGIPMSLLPQKIGDFLANFVARWRLGDLTRYGMRPPEWSIFKDGRIPMIDVGYIPFLKQGKIEVKSDIEHFTKSGVVFDDGSSADYDVIIAATGYRTGLANYLDVPNVLDEEGNVTVECGEPTSHKGLWFIGLVDSPAGVIMAARMHSRKIAKYIATDLGVL